MVYIDNRIVVMALIFKNKNRHTINTIKNYSIV